MSVKLEPKSRTLQCKDLHEYLKTLSATILDRLYEHPITCLAVYRELSEIAKHYIIRILFVDQSVPQAVFSQWISKAYAKEHKEAVEALAELKIWKESSVTGGLPVWEINPIFKKHLRVSLLGGDKDSFITSHLTADTKPRDLAFLDAYAMERWECVLHYMVGSHQQEGISPDAVRVLLHAGLMRADTDGSAVITKEGFQFLLMDTAAQVWYFILQYLSTVEERKLDLALCLRFLFQLRFSILGKDYSTEGMDEGLLVFLQHLREFGLVYQRKRKAGRFYPTRIALNMAAGRNKSENAVREGYIIVETNYRVYVYTDSHLKVSLVALFTNLLYRFPNVAVGVLSRESLRSAMRSGITANQIVGFLKMHAHPRMIAKSGPVLPPTIVDQIYLWEQELNRLSFSEGVLYSQFVSQNDFETLRDYAQDLGVLVWQNEKKRTMVVTKSSHEDVKKFWKRHSKSNS